MEVTLLTIAALGIAALGGYTDVRSGKVYNALTYPAAALGVAMQMVLTATPAASLGLSGRVFGTVVEIQPGATGLLAGLGLGTLTALAGLIVGLGLLLVPYLLGFVGAGDVKLLAAVGAFIGPRDTAVVMVLGAAFGGILAVFLLLRRRELVGMALQLAISPRQTLAAASLEKGDFPFATTVPLGLAGALLLGALAA